jgi:hypothetical protein
MMRRMKAATLAAAVFAMLLSWAALAQEQGFTNRATELKDKASADASTVAQLPENTPVKVLARGGGWTQVDAGGKTGWVRVFHLRFPTTVESGSGSGSGLSGLGAALGFGGTGNRKANLATTGIRGLSPEDLKNASPNPAELEKLHSYRVDKGAAERFARDAKLAAVKIDTPEAIR